MLFSLVLYPFIHKPSRITEFFATLIDNILTNDICTKQIYTQNMWLSRLMAEKKHRPHIGKQGLKE